jgi:hypothetical protein
LVTGAAGAAWDSRAVGSIDRVRHGRSASKVVCGNTNAVKWCREVGRSVVVFGFAVGGLG